MNSGIDTFLPMIGQVSLANVGTSTVNAALPCAALSGAAGSWARALKLNTMHANSERNMTATSRTVMRLRDVCRACSTPSRVARQGRERGRRRDADLGAALTTAAGDCGDGPGEVDARPRSSATCDRCH